MQQQRHQRTARPCRKQTGSRQQRPQLKEERVTQPQLMMMMQTAQQQRQVQQTQRLARTLRKAPCMRQQQGRSSARHSRPLQQPRRRPCRQPRHRYGVRVPMKGLSLACRMCPPRVSAPVACLPGTCAPPLVRTPITCLPATCAPPPVRTPITTAGVPPLRPGRRRAPEAPADGAAWRG